MVFHQGMSTSPLFKTSRTPYRIERRDYCVSLSLTYNASDTWDTITPTSLRRTGGATLMANPALRVST